MIYILSFTQKILTFDCSSQSLCSDGLANQRNDRDNPDEEQEHDLLRAVVVDEADGRIVRAHYFVRVCTQQQRHQENHLQDGQYEQEQPTDVVQVKGLRPVTGVPVEQRHEPEEGEGRHQERTPDLKPVIVTRKGVGQQVPDH